jgi:uncharacterized protein YecE (DUF72 family)
MDTIRRAWDRTLRFARLLGAEKVLFQCPPSFQPTSRNKDRMRRFFGGIEREGIVCLWEPRGRWERADVAALCRERGLVHAVDPLKGRPVGRGLRYWRPHGTGGYRHTHTDEELRRLAVMLGGRPAYVLFNNVAMFDDARRFASLLP